MLSPRLLINLSLFCTIIGLAAFLIINEEKKITDDYAVPLTQIQAGSIDIIHIERRDLEDIIFQKRGNDWYQHTPFNLPADTARIQALFRLLQTPSYDQFTAEDNDLAPFMLDAPAVSVRFNKTRISMGNKNPLQEKLRYVLVKDRIHIISDNLFYQLQAPPTFFISPRLIPPGAKVREISLSGTMITADNIEDVADPYRRLLDAWSDVEAIAVRRYEPMAVIENIKLVLDTDELIQFMMTSARPHLTLARPDLGIQYHIADVFADHLFLQSLSIETVTE